MRTFQVGMPAYPECWATCGSCARRGVFINAIQVQPGDTLRRDDPILTLETNKVDLDIPSPRAGQVLEVHVCLGDAASPGTPLITLALA